MDEKKNVYVLLIFKIFRVDPSFKLAAIILP